MNPGMNVQVPSNPAGSFSEEADAQQPEDRELELELIQPHMAQKPVLRGEVGCAPSCLPVTGSNNDE